MPDKADLLAHARLALRCLDLTSLNDADTAADVARLCARARRKAPQHLYCATAPQPRPA